jgi:hypothetical protein
VLGKNRFNLLIRREATFAGRFEATVNSRKFYRCRVVLAALARASISKAISASSS